LLESISSFMCMPPATHSALWHSLKISISSTRNFLCASWFYSMPISMFKLSTFVLLAWTLFIEKYTNHVKFHYSQFTENIPALKRHAYSIYMLKASGHLIKPSLFLLTCLHLRPHFCQNLTKIEKPTAFWLTT